VTIKEMLYKFVATRNVPYNIPSSEEKRAELWERKKVQRKRLKMKYNRS
jgi:hypothetical protein